VNILDTTRRVREGLMPAGVYSDAAIHHAERQRIFAKTWNFVAHEAEIPNAGDFVLRQIAGDSFIVVRGNDGKVRVLLNMCRHRGMQVCRSEAGTTERFRCPYHAWTYSNTGALALVPFQGDVLGPDESRRQGLGLAEPAQTAMYRGMVFATLNAEAPPLDEFLGDFRFFLDIYFHQSEGGIDIRGPQRWRINSNWKIGAENFVGDSYHTPHTHVSVVEVGLFREPKASRRREGALYWAAPGGGTTYKLPTTDFEENLAYIGYPPEMVARMASTWTPEQQRLVGPAGFMVSAATLFPNVSLVHNWPAVHEGTDVVPFISLRQWHPVSATETEVYSWFVVDRLAPDWFKADSYKAYLMCFGSSGMFEQDDVENWTSITTVSQGAMASQVELELRLGFDPSTGEVLGTPVANWPAPGRAYTGYGEFNQRELLTMWADHLEREPAG
jgi:phthalate 3,4-dioxygenase subunit alpha